MPEYLSPNVYVEKKNTVVPVDRYLSDSTGGFVGTTIRGVLNVPVLVTSWNSFLENFAYGMETPFIAESDLAYSVYGFFQNGGKRCYIIRTAHSTAAAATASITVGSATTTITAKDKGTWGNKLKVKVTANADESSNFDIVVKYDGEEVEKYVNVSTTTTASNYWVDAIGASRFITATTGGLTASSSEVSFSGGVDGISDITDSDYTDALNYFDTVSDLNLICIPGQVSSTVTSAIVSYVEERKNMFAILDGAKSADVSSIKSFGKSNVSKNAALYYPWIKVIDPLSKTGRLRDCPTCGHVMGVYARIIQNRGIWKSPAGTEANIRGAVEVMKLLTKEDLDGINPIGINAIVPKANYGIVVWGARSLSSDDSMRYVSDVLLESYISRTVEELTQWAVFEPNNEILWSKVQTTVEAFLDALWKEGGLAGTEAKQAYYVKCDEDLNPESSRNEGKLYCELGYAPLKPAEFVIIRIAHSISE